MLESTELSFEAILKEPINGQHVLLYNGLSYDQIDEMIKIVTEFQRADVLNGLNLSTSHVSEYLSRGGQLVLVEKGTTIEIIQEEVIIAGCNAGMCRSQATAGFLRKQGISVEHIIAGRDSAINFSKEVPYLRNPTASELDALSFQTVFNCNKLPQVGHHLGREQSKNLQEARDYYVSFIDSLSNRTHFLVFGMSGPVILLHLLQRTGTLEGFKISYFNWADSITHCTEKHSVEAYQRFVEQLKKHLIF